jgi:cold shock protein
VQGTVKWFSQEKGYGFIVGADGTERYFNVRSVKGASIPKTGASVEFSATESARGPKATDVKLLSQAVGHNDERIPCQHCGKKIVPRIITDRGVLRRSVCPFCGGTVKNFRSWWPFVVVLVAALLYFLVSGRPS